MSVWGLYRLVTYVDGSLKPPNAHVSTWNRSMFAVNGTLSVMTSLAHFQAGVRIGIKSKNRLRPLPESSVALVIKIWHPSSARR